MEEETQQRDDDDFLRSRGSGDGEGDESAWAPPVDERTAVGGTSGWWPSWLSWRPTSLQLLAETERAMLRPVKTGYQQRMVKIDDSNNQINTIRLGSGPPLVLIHGFGAALGYWACNLDAFARHNTVYALDILGFGRSSRPRITATTCEEAEDYLVESIEKWRKAVGLESFTLLGHSFGGYLSAAYSLKYPGRVNRLILADPWGIPKRDPEQSKTETMSFRFRVITTAIAWAPPLTYLRAAGPYGPGLIHKFRPDLIEKFEHLEYDKEEEETAEEELERQQEQKEQQNVLKKQKEESKNKIPLVIRYVYHTNAQSPPSGEQLFSLMSIPFAWAKNPMLDRLHTLHPRIPVSFLYGHDTWMDPRAGLAVMEKMQSRADLYVIPKSGHHIYVDNYPHFNKVVSQILKEGRMKHKKERKTQHDKVFEEKEKDHKEDEEQEEEEEDEEEEEIIEPYSRNYYYQRKVQTRCLGCVVIDMFARLTEKDVALIYDVLAFGDSITEGYTENGQSWHPYSTTLTKLLQRPNPGSKVTNAGKSGESLADMPERLLGSLKRQESSNKIYSHVVIFVGMEELESLSGENIFSVLQTLHSHALRHNARSVAITLPPAGITDTQINAQRAIVNTKIRELVKPYQKDKRMLLLDLDVLEAEHKSLQWDEEEEGIQLTPAGHERLASLIFDVLTSHPL